jgi:signal transduction histidine kinase
MAPHRMSADVPRLGTPGEARPTPPLDAAHAEHVAAELLRMVLLHTRAGTLLATAFAVLLAIYWSGSTPSAWVRGWMFAKLAVAALRIVSAHKHARAGLPATRGWRQLTYGLLALDGAIWGLAGLWLMHQPVQVSSFVAAALACVTCVATFGLQARLLATAAYVGPIMVPTALGLALRADQVGVVGSLGLLMMLGLQLLTARGAEQRLTASILLRLEAQALAHEKAAALELAQRQIEVKTQFLANISHELRTPLHGILGVARLLHLEAGEPTVQHRLELIESSGTHLLRLINDLIDVSRIETGHFPIRHEVFDIVTQAGLVADVFALRATDKGLDFSMTHAFPRPSWVVGDAARFRQVLHNLLGNAIKFTEAGRVEINLGRGSTPDMVEVEVIDTGPGMAPADQDRLFEAPSALDSGCGPAGRNHGGLGLLIARELAEAMGGSLSVHSKAGVGSQFVFRARLPATAAPDETEHGAAPATPVIDLRRVLVAEDDDVSALIVCAYLKQQGLAHERVGNGHDAVGRALRESQRPDLVLMDCQMPTMDGQTATREIRAQEHTLGLPRVPIIAITATSTDEDRRACADAGMDDLLAKPFNRQELMQVLAQWGGALPSSGVTPPDEPHREEAAWILSGTGGRPGGRSRS